MLKRTRDWATNGQNLLFVALIVLHLIPIWTFKYFPSQDGPAHLENAKIIREYNHPDGTVFRAYYLLNENLTPNWFGHLMLAGLMSLMPILVAEKVFLTGYIILLPVSVRYTVSAVRPDSGFLAVLVFPFVYNYPFHMGFYSFAYSLPLFFFFIGYWLNHRKQFTARDVINLSMLSLLLYFGHIVSMVAAFLGLVLMSIWAIFVSWFEQPRKRQFSGYLVQNALSVLKPLYAVVPTISFFAIFFFQTKRNSLPLSWEDKPSPRILFKEFLSLYSIVSFERKEVWLSRATVCLFVAVILYILYSRWGRLRLTFWDGFIGIAAIYAIVYFVGPSEIGGGAYIHDRMNLYAYLTLIIWFAAQSYGPIVRRFVQVLAIGVAASLLGLHSLKYRELNDYLGEYLSGIHYIERNTTLLPIYFSERGDGPDGQALSLRINPFLNAAGYIAVERRIIDLGNYEAGQTRYFPVLFRSYLNPALHLSYALLDSASRWSRSVPTAILGYPQHTGGEIDYVLLWGVRDQDRSTETATSMFTQLREGYDLIYTSSQRGLMQLYRRKNLKAQLH